MVREGLRFNEIGYSIVVNVELMFSVFLRSNGSVHVYELLISENWNGQNHCFVNDTTAETQCMINSWSKITIFLNLER